MDQLRNVTVIGAGIVGMACASYLKRDGHDVKVIDPLPPGEGCSKGNAGHISPGGCLRMHTLLTRLRNLIPVDLI